MGVLHGAWVCMHGCVQHGMLLGVALRLYGVLLACSLDLLRCLHVLVCVRRGGQGIDVTFAAKACSCLCGP